MKLLFLFCLMLHSSVAAGPTRGCKNTKKGEEYEGYVSQTNTGKTCQRWDHQYPHAHTRNNIHNFPDAHLIDAANYCRNPDNEPEGPWCYTTDPDSRWEYCDVPYCECKEDTLGTQYHGKMAVTQSGKTCQAWKEQFPHQHTRNNIDRFPDDTLDEASNYCRNPDNESKGPWCYTTDPNSRWEYCDVPVCECKSTVKGTTYTGSVAETNTGLQCQRWDSMSPHYHWNRFDSQFPDGSAAAAGNYCRNPDNEDDGPWCYTTNNDVRWQLCNVPSCGKPDEPPPQIEEIRNKDCKDTRKGLTYSGKVNTTISGRTCQRWDAQLPHIHFATNPDKFPESHLSQAENYCRNPDKDNNGVWCYTTDILKRWEYCEVPMCDNPQECKEDDMGTTYRGKVSETVSGKTCQRWDSQSPHIHTRNNLATFPDATLADAENYCRNPDNEPEGPWCYTVDSSTRWEYCDISKCGEEVTATLPPTTPTPIPTKPPFKDIAPVGYERQGDYGMECPGNDLASHDVDLPACGALCDREEDCVGIVYSTHDSTNLPCWLKTQLCDQPVSKEKTAIYSKKPDTKPKEWTLRLTGGPHPNEGRLEVFLNDTWGLVCANGWAQDSKYSFPQVACRDMGYIGCDEAANCKKKNCVDPSIPIAVKSPYCTKSALDNFSLCGTREKDCNHDRTIYLTCNPEILP